MNVSYNQALKGIQEYNQKVVPLSFSCNIL